MPGDGGHCTPRTQPGAWCPAGPQQISNQHQPLFLQQTHQGLRQVVGSGFKLYLRKTEGTRIKRA